MKLYRTLFFAAMLPALGVMQAQTSYEAVSLLDTDLSGTARYVGMGGAMSALGADMSAMSTNPAGTALYRSWDVALSFGGNGVVQHTASNSNRARLFSSYGSFDNAGVVIATKKSNEDILRFVNFGFNYRNVKRYGGKMGMTSNLGGKFSQTEQMAWQAWENVGNIDYTYFDPGSAHNLFDMNYFMDNNYGWMTLLGAYADLMGIYPIKDTNLTGCMTTYAIETGAVVKFTTAFNLNQDMLKYHCAKLEDKNDIMEPYLTADILFVDDLGSENKIQNVTNEYLYLIINERMAGHKKTVITTNFEDFEQIQDVYGERVFSRLMHKQQSVKIKFNGTDLRIKGVKSKKGA